MGLSGSSPRFPFSKGEGRSPSLREKAGGVGGGPSALTRGGSRKKISNEISVVSRKITNLTRKISCTFRCASEGVPPFDTAPLFEFREGGCAPFTPAWGTENTPLNPNLYKYKISIAYQAGYVKGVGAKEGKGIEKNGRPIGKRKSQNLLSVSKCTHPARRFALNGRFFVKCHKEKS